MSPIRQLRVVSALEGVSFLVLLFIAMPLKYGFDMPTAVRVVGMAHGVLFVAYLAALAWAMRSEGWGLGRGAVGFGASILPFGFIYFDRVLREAEAEAARQRA